MRAGREQEVRAGGRHRAILAVLPGRALPAFRDFGILPAFCGVVVSDRYANYAAADAHSAEISACLPHLLDTLLSQVAAGGPPSSWPLGLIEGVAGIALTLHTIAAETNGGWETCLLIC